MRRASWLSRNVDLLAVSCVIVFAAAANLASGVVQSNLWRMRIDGRHFEEVRPAIMEIHHEARQLRDQIRHEARQVQEEIRRSVRPRIE